MATLHVRNVPDELYEELRASAAREGRSIGAEAISLLQTALGERARMYEGAKQTVARRVDTLFTRASRRARRRSFCVRRMPAGSSAGGSDAGARAARDARGRRASSNARAQRDHGGGGPRSASVRRRPVAGLRLKPPRRGTRARKARVHSSGRRSCPRQSAVGSVVGGSGCPPRSRIAALHRDVRLRGCRMRAAAIRPPQNIALPSACLDSAGSTWR